MSASRAAVREGIPLLIPAIPFGLVLGVAIAESSVPNSVGWLGSSIIFGGAAQLTVVTVLGAGGAAVAAAVSGLVVNTRHFMYSAALATRFRDQPRWFRWLAPYMLLDQVFALVILREDNPEFFRRYYLTAGAMFWSTWQLVVGIGVVAGAAVPEAWSIDFAVPILFLALALIGIRTPPMAVAAGVGFLATAAAAHLPNRTGLLVGAVTGIVAGFVAERSWR